ncbi:hypothetical protein [Thermicanus aegyptius]|uniref:hypothetical protein n=1 Tax=Thermicanus aegyptius TaxID=94009 RepID=UPI0003FBD112|nr:hypothetical protein [Thermicanus aegyptius]
MACTKDGTPSPYMLELLRTLSTSANGLTEEEMIRRVSLPAYRIRSVLRELVQQGYLHKGDEGYHMTETGKEMLHSS